MKKIDEYLRRVQDQLNARRKLLESGKIRLERDEAEDKARQQELAFESAQPKK